MYDSSKALFHIYNKRGDNTEAAKYADLYIQISDSIDLGKRQELAATVNNEFQYHLDKNEERRIMEENDRFRFLLAISFMTCVITLFTASLVIIYRRNKHLQKMLTMSEEQNRLINEKENLLQNIDKQENELAEVKMQLKSQDTELGHLKFQNQTFLNLLHQSELEEKAEDVIYTIRQSAEGKKNMQSTDWKQLYKAVDELYPTFQNLLLEKLGNFTEQQMQVCHLMRIGLSKPQIQNMTNLSRVTIWRWTKKYEWILGLV